MCASAKLLQRQGEKPMHTLCMLTTEPTPVICCKTMLHPDEASVAISTVYFGSHRMSSPNLCTGGSMRQETQPMEQVSPRTYRACDPTPMESFLELLSWSQQELAVMQHCKQLVGSDDPDLSHGNPPCPRNLHRAFRLNRFG